MELNDEFMLRLNARQKNIAVNDDILSVLAGKLDKDYLYEDVDTKIIYRLNKLDALYETQPTEWDGETTRILTSACLFSSVDTELSSHIFVRIKDSEVFIQNTKALSLTQTSVNEFPETFNGTLYDLLQRRLKLVNIVDSSLGKVITKKDTDPVIVEIVDEGIVSTEALNLTSKNAKNIREVFDTHCSVTVSRNSLTTLFEFISDYAMGNEDHAAFLGGNSVGTVRLHYRPDDRDRWVDKILNCEDLRDLTRAYHSLDTVNTDFKVASNPINASYIYIAHRYMASSLSVQEREKGAILAITMMHYQFLASLFYHQFPYGAQEGISMAVYESLTRKSMLKRYHTWSGVVEAICTEIISPKAIHYKDILNFKDDDRIIYTITDIQTRIRMLVNKLKSEYMRLREEDNRVMSQGIYFLDEDGDQVLKDFENKTQRLQRDLQAAVRDRHTLIKKELVEVTLKMVSTADIRYLEETLEYFVYATLENHKDGKRLDTFIHDFVIYMQSTIRSLGPKDNNIIGVITKIRNTMRSSQLTDPTAVEIRDIALKLVEKALPRRPKPVLVSTRIAVIVYIAIFLFTNLKYKQ